MCTVCHAMSSTGVYYLYLVSISAPGCPGLTPEAPKPREKTWTGLPRVSARRPASWPHICADRIAWPEKRLTGG